MSVNELTSKELYQYSDFGDLKFQTTQELEPLDEKEGTIGQPRAIEALRFGTGMQSEGYNIFALGSPGTGRHTLAKQILSQKFREKKVPEDICYINNFQNSSKPNYILLPPGKGNAFAKDMDNLIEESRNDLKTAFESEEYQNRRQTIEQEIKDYQQKAFEELRQKAQEKGLTLVRTPNGIAFAPVKEGEVVSPENFQKLPEEERKQYEEEIQELESESQKIFQNFPKIQKQAREKLKELNDDVINQTISHLIEDMREKYRDIPEVGEYLDAVFADITENVNALLNPQGQQQTQQTSGISQGGQSGQGTLGFSNPELRKYKVNILVDHSEDEGAPVIYEDHPTYANLVGRVEHLPQMGALITDFNLIKPGALHRANGGALVLDARKVITQPGAWDGLKRTLIAGEIKIESLAEMFSLISTVTLEPQPLPLDVKVVLIGSPFEYYILKYMDPEFQKLFKVAAEFDTRMDWNAQNQELLAHLVSQVVGKNNLKHFERRAVARIVEYGAREAGDKEKLSSEIEKITDLIKESSYWAEKNANNLVKAEDVEKAIEAWTYRSDRIRERIQEEIGRGTLQIDLSGERVGQINGLSVLKLGDFMFGRPNRITARISMGKGEVLDIEREVELGGPIHSKGVLILSGFLKSRYSLDQPLSLSASLVFEQSYAGIEGDSASSAELYSLVSAIANVGIKQNLAVTGAVNQHGEIQAIGGVNQKIEGFFDVCKQQGLSGDQGVLIPESNVKHLMLRWDVIESVEKGDFHVYPVQTFDQGIELLTGTQAGEADENNKFPQHTFNYYVQQRLEEFASKHKQYTLGADKGGQSD